MSSVTQVYPCTRGTGLPLGWHDFTVVNGVSVCRLCGEVRRPEARRPSRASDSGAVGE